MLLEVPTLRTYLMSSGSSCREIDRRREEIVCSVGPVGMKGIWRCYIAGGDLQTLRLIHRID